MLSLFTPKPKWEELQGVLLLAHFMDEGTEAQRG